MNDKTPHKSKTITLKLPIGLHEKALKRSQELLFDSLTEYIRLCIKMEMGLIPSRRTDNRL